MNSPYSHLIEEADKKKLAGNFDAAITICEKVIINDLECLEAYEELGDNFLSLKEYEKAIKALNRAIKLDPLSPNAHYLLGFTHSALSNWGVSVEHLETADILHPNHPEILRCLGWSIFHAGNRARGIILLERARALCKDDNLILNDLAICYLNTKEFDKAIELLKHALAIDPDCEKTSEILKTALFFKSEYEKIEENKIKKDSK